MVAHPWRGRGSRRGGFTLLELLVVIFIISVILGMSMGAMSKMAKKNALEATTSGARALLRRARNASQEERFGATVEIDARSSEMRAQLKTTLTRFRFEVSLPGAEPDPLAPGAPAPGAPAGGTPAPPLPGDGELPGVSIAQPAGPKDRDRPPEWPAPYVVPGSLQHDMVVDGGEPAQGRYGQGLVFERGGAWAHLPDRPALSPAEGLSIECWVYLGKLEDALLDRPRKDDRTPEQIAREELSGPAPRAPTARVRRWRQESRDDPPHFVVCRKGRAWSLSVTADYEVEVGLTGDHPEGGGEVTFVTRTKPDTLMADRWYRLALVYSGDPRKDGAVSDARLRLFVDGIPRTHVPLARQDVLPRKLIRDVAPLVLSDPHPDACFFGVIDELLVAGLLEAQRLPLPKDVLVVASDDVVAFDLLGQLDPARHAEPVIIFFSDDLKAFEAIDPPAPAGPGPPSTGLTLTREEAASRVVTDRDKLRRLAQALPTIDKDHKRSLVIERTGLVRDGD